MKMWALETGSELSYSEWAISEVDDSGCFLYSGEDWYLYEYCMDKGFSKLNSTIEEYVHNTPKIRGPEVTIGSKVTTMFFLDADSDYYLNSSVLGKPLWNMMDSRISATRVNHGLPDKLGDDVKMWPMHQEELPVYFPRKVNRAMLASSIALMLPSASDNRKYLTIDEKSIYLESTNMLPVIFDATKDHKSEVLPTRIYKVWKICCFLIQATHSRNSMYVHQEPAFCPSQVKIKCSTKLLAYNLTQIL
ncbi:hypothetical protein HPP92_022228 [Vanilla planifolia]|uniref:Uncharacterized protein n=1 Tax=Vanilla planifolia TaxID=51239 RepID=A0A835UFG0_VANPL|nr:hypothetical protein HPP92_022228 [Vanilla planifolia]